MAQNPGLGSLSCLPAEIRVEIWRCLSPTTSHDRSPGYCKMGFLRCSRAIHEEAIWEIYRDTVLHIWVYNNHQGISVKSNATLRRYGPWSPIEIPYHMLRAIEIHILPPKPFDPGQMIYLWLRSRLVSQYLRNRMPDGLPHLKIILEDDVSTSGDYQFYGVQLERSYSSLNTDDISECT